MLKLTRSKIGVSLVELIAAIVIIGIASTTITSMIITSYRGQLRATQYQVAREIAKTYDSMLSRDTIRANVREMGMDAFKDSSNPDEKYISITSDILKNMTKTEDSDDTHVSPVYDCYYGSGFTLNGNTFDSSNVSIKIKMINTSLCYYLTEVTVTYQNDRQVTYNGSHYND